MIKSVYLSPSNQENNIGVNDYGTEEIQMNKVTDVAERILKLHGVTVYRNSPNWNLSKIVEDSNDKNSIIHLAIHSNANIGRSRGCEVYCHRFGGEGERLAKLIYDEVSAITPTSDRGVKEGYNFYGKGKSMYELAKTNAPAALVEVAFHDSVDDANWIMGNIELIGVAIAKSVLKYFGIPFKDAVSDLDTAIDVLRKYGFITSADYWSQNAIKGKVINGESAAILIKRVAAFLMKELQ
jgi:N-acetylmuramoyl-L-alanine amidase